ncbi:peptidase inhibitor family I36 protein [Nonomuraea polychroma]|uniref:peptidase inhibitor family I36 protein n=1 Tax=Nonomuraea polychroma TaxID=46176 RepID=UPI003D8FF385
MKMLRMFAGLVLALAGGILLSPSANAMPQCPAGTFCLWNGTYASAGIAVFGLSDLNYDGDRFSDGTPVNDRATYVRNNTNFPINLYKHAGANIRDRCYTVQPGEEVHLQWTSCWASVSSHYATGV